MAKIILLKGLPASGKSTWANEKIEKGPYMRVSKDDIRRDMLGNWSQKKEKAVIKIRNELIKLGIGLGKNVIVDDTNLNPIHEKNIRQIADELGVAFEVNDSFLKITPEECVARDLHRGEKAVGPSVIYGMWNKYLRPQPLEKLEEDWDKRRCVIVDIDGTLAHNLSGRNIFDYSRVKEDTPDPFVSSIVDGIKEANGPYYVDIVIVSGREGNEECRAATEEWLKNNMIPYDKFYMREEGDHRPDEIVKEEIYHKYIENKWAVLGVVDDRPKVCRMWRKLGFAVAQVGDPYNEF